LATVLTLPMDSPINQAHFALVTDGDLDFAMELLQAYLEDTQVRMERIAQGIQDHDRELVCRSAHHLRGSSSNLGIVEMPQIAREMEMNPLSWEELGERLQRMRAIVQQVQSYTDTLSAKVVSDR